MGGHGRCCCAECECLPVEDLPTVTITNHTGGGWSGTCCYQQIFTPNTTPSWSKSCTSLLYEASVAEECVTEHWTQTAGEYRGFEYFTGDDCNTIPDDFCCPGAYEKIATTTTNSEWTDNAFMALWRRPKHIIVQISRELVNCDGIEGQTGGCKIVIRSRYVYEYATTFYRNEFNPAWQSVTMHNTDCFEINQDFVKEQETPTAFTCSDVPSSPPSGGIGGDPCVSLGEFYFDRVRYYDDMPNGSIQFTNSEVPGCTASTCDYTPYNYAASVCIFSPSAPIVGTGGCFFNEPCYCTDEVFPVNQTLNYGPVVCGGDVTIDSIAGCNANPCLPFSCEFILTNCEDLTSFTCPSSSYSTECLTFDIDPENPATCFREGIGFALGTTPNSCQCANSLAIAGGTLPPYTRTVECDDPTNCNLDCCQYFDDCECCFPDGRCRKIHTGFFWQTVVEHTRTQTCSGLSSQSVCTNAPQWTINLA